MNKFPLRPYQSSLALAAMQMQMLGGVPAAQTVVLSGDNPRERARERNVSYGAYGSSYHPGNSEGTPLSILSSGPFRQNYPEWARMIGGKLRELPRPDSMTLLQFCNLYYPGGDAEPEWEGSLPEALAMMIKDDIMYKVQTRNFELRDYQKDVVDSIIRMGRQSKDFAPYVSSIRIGATRKAYFNPGTP